MSNIGTLSSSLATDYDRLAAAIAALPSTHPHPRDIAALAAVAESGTEDWPALLPQWAGTSPQAFWRSLTPAAIRSRLAASRAQRDTTVSGEPSCAPSSIQLTIWPPEPGEQVDENWAIAYGLHATRFGSALVATTPQGLCAFQFCAAAEVQSLLDQLRQRWPQATLYHAPEQTQLFSDRLHSTHSPPESPLTLAVAGTPFQRRVWRSLLTVPSGQLATYRDIAAQLGQPQAARAVGTAIGANPIAYWIPCHRVVRATGAIGGYRWGAWRKALMLGWEACQLSEDG